MKTSFFRAALLVAALPLALSLSALAQTPAKPDSAIATVNGKPVSRALLDDIVNNAAQRGVSVTPQMLTEVQNQLISMEVLRQEAERRKVDQSNDFRTKLEFVRNQLMVRMLGEQLQKEVKVTPEEIQTAYDQYKQNTGNGKEYKVRHILVASEAKAKDLLAQIKRGKSFDELAKKNSIDAGSAKNGGDLGWAAAEGYVPEFAAAVKSLGKGSLSESPIKSQYGYHIIRVDDVRNTTVPTLEEIAPKIREELLNAKLQEYQAKLVQNASIKKTELVTGTATETK